MIWELYLRLNVCKLEEEIRREGKKKVRVRKESLIDFFCGFSSEMKKWNGSEEVEWDYI